LVGNLTIVSQQCLQGPPGLSTGRFRFNQPPNWFTPNPQRGFWRGFSKKNTQKNPATHQVPLYAFCVGGVWDWFFHPHPHPPGGNGDFFFLFGGGGGACLTHPHMPPTIVLLPIFFSIVCITNPKKPHAIFLGPRGYIMFGVAGGETVHDVFHIFLFLLPDFFLIFGNPNTFVQPNKTLITPPPYSPPGFWGVDVLWTFWGFPPTFFTTYFFSDKGGGFLGGGGCLFVDG